MPSSSLFYMNLGNQRPIIVVAPDFNEAALRGNCPDLNRLQRLISEINPVESYPCTTFVENDLPSGMRVLIVQKRNGGTLPSIVCPICQIIPTWIHEEPIAIFAAV